MKKIFNPKGRQFWMLTTAALGGYVAWGYWKWKMAPAGAYGATANGNGLPSSMAESESVLTTADAEVSEDLAGILRGHGYY